MVRHAHHPEFAEGGRLGGILQMDVVIILRLLITPFLMTPLTLHIQKKFICWNDGNRSPALFDYTFLFQCDNEALF